MSNFGVCFVYLQSLFFSFLGVSHRYPDKKFILQNISVIDVHVLEKCTTSPAYGPTGDQFKDLVLAIQDLPRNNEEWEYFRFDVCDALVEHVANQKYLLPSTLLNTVTGAAEYLLSDREQRDHLVEHLTEVAPASTSKEIMQNFICDYILKCVTELISFISLSVRGSNNQALKTVRFNEEDQQIIHYCAGANIRGFLNMAKRFPRNESWKRIALCIQSQILESDSAASGNQQKIWTESQSRGRLLDVNAKAVDFFMCIYKCCILCERSDGCLQFHDVLKKLHEEGGTAIWDCLVSDTLSPKESLNFMNGVVRSFTQTCGNGIARKRLNELAGQKAMISLTLRHRVAPK
jgi:hypothetical protein